MSKDIKQIVNEICATMRLSGLELKTNEVLWLYYHAEKVVREQVKTEDIIKQLVEEYIQKGEDICNTDINHTTKF